MAAVASYAEDAGNGGWNLSALAPAGDSYVLTTTGVVLSAAYGNAEIALHSVTTGPAILTDSDSGLKQ